MDNLRGPGAQKPDQVPTEEETEVANALNSRQKGGQDPGKPVHRASRLLTRVDPHNRLITNGSWTCQE